MDKVNRILMNSTFCKCIGEIKAAEEHRFFCGHGIGHLLDVARIMWINALESKLCTDKQIIYAAALLHDIGRAKAYLLHTDHAKESAEIARNILDECGFGSEEIRIITNAILHHNDEENADVLCSLLRTADKKSRNCFMCSAYELCKWSENEKNRGVTV